MITTENQAEQMFQRKMQQAIVTLEALFSDSPEPLRAMIQIAIQDFHLRCNEAFLWSEFFALVRSPETE